MRRDLTVASHPSHQEREAMNSRQPGTMPPGTTGRAAFPGRGGDRGTAGAGHGRGSAQPWPVLVLPVTALIIVGLAGLQGQVTGPRWDGPLHGDPVAVGIALEIVLGVMLAITARRLVTRTRSGTVRGAPASAVAVKLRRVLAVVLGAGMIAIAVTTPVGLHDHLFSGPAGAGAGAGQGAGAHPGQAAGARPSRPAAAPGGRFHFHLFSLHLHLTTALLYGLVVLLFLGGVVLRVWWVRQYRPSRKLRAYHYLGPAGPDLLEVLEVVESGRSALRAIDDARAAIIACYVAMESRLAERGAARAAADTPDELLARATQSGIVHGTAAARLTALFYEARFSSHPLDRGQRDAAGHALDELAAALTRSEPAGALPIGEGT
jgi:hypothetical protein